VLTLKPQPQTDAKGIKLRHPMNLIVLLLATLMVGCSGTGQESADGNVKGYLFRKTSLCSENSCRLKYVGDFIFYIDPARQKVRYRIKKVFDDGISQDIWGELNGCQVVAVTDFKCEGLNSSDGTIGFSLRASSNEKFEFDKAEDFSFVDSFSPSYVSKYMAQGDWLTDGNKGAVDAIGKFVFYVVIAFVGLAFMAAASSS